jgi:hypothetical protein
VTAPRKNAATTRRGKPFARGNPGRPAGSKNKATLALESLLAGEGEALTRKAIELALGGDATVLRACLDRVLPLRRGRPVNFALPALDTAADLSLALGAVLAATADGSLTPDEALTLAQIVDRRRAAIETVELSERVAALEAGVRQ